MKILNFETDYSPSYETRKDLIHLQNWFQATHRDIFFEVRCDYQSYYIRSEMLANRIRDKWVILEGIQVLSIDEAL